MFCTPHQIFLGDQINNNEMGGACSMYIERGGVHTGFWWGNLREIENLEDLVYMGK
jgi:hypothetical protein